MAMERLAQVNLHSVSIQKRKKALCEKCPYSELFWSVFSDIWTEYGEIYSVRMRENTDQNNSE